MDEIISSVPVYPPFEKGGCGGICSKVPVGKIPLHPPFPKGEVIDENPDRTYDFVHLDAVLTELGWHKVEHPRKEWIPPHPVKHTQVGPPTGKPVAPHVNDIQATPDALPANASSAIRHHPRASTGNSGRLLED